MIYECCPYFNEKLIAGLKINCELPDRRLIIGESDYTFRKAYKGFTFDLQAPSVDYRKYEVEDVFKKFSFFRKNLNRVYLKFWPGISEYDRHRWSSHAWFNEATQRNLVSQVEQVKDTDFVIFSDIDEFVDPRHWPQIEELVKKHGIITIPVYNTMFYFNLRIGEYGGPKNFSYRIFIMTGKVYRNLKYSSDELRRKGERGQLFSEVYCPETFMGFHHSWIGDINQLVNKINSFAHTLKELGIPEDLDNEGIKNFLITCVNNKESVIVGHELYIDRDMPLLEPVAKGLNPYSEFVL